VYGAPPPWFRSTTARGRVSSRSITGVSIPPWCRTVCGISKPSCCKHTGGVADVLQLSVRCMDAHMCAWWRSPGLGM
jgi:hypothetical protein